MQMIDVYATERTLADKHALDHKVAALLEALAVPVPAELKE